MFAVRRTALKVLSNVRAKHNLPDLPYPYEALEPVISREIMTLHHQKHHAAYVNNLNLAQEKLASAMEKGDTSAIISLQGALRFNGGGHINHSIFWNNLSPCATQPSQKLLGGLCGSFGSIDEMKKQLSEAAVGVQGSGWAWLGYCKKSDKLRILTCGNQDPLEGTTGVIPLLGIDVWEHAYYLQYQNVRADYVKAIFDIVHWKDVSERYDGASKAC